MHAYRCRVHSFDSRHSSSSVSSESEGLKLCSNLFFSPYLSAYVLNRFRAVQRKNGVFAEIFYIKSLRFFSFFHMFRLKSEKKLKSRRNCPNLSVYRTKFCVQFSPFKTGLCTLTNQFLERLYTEWRVNGEIWRIFCVQNDYKNKKRDSYNILTIFSYKST